jgi:protein gp37
MAEETLIAWTSHTFNGWLGCTKVSAGCANCYAETLATNRMGLNVWGPTATRKVTTTPWQNARMWNRAAARAGVRRRVFCGSMMDWAEDHPVANRTRAAVWELVRECSWLDWQMLTKRPQRIRECLPKDWGSGGYANVWLGTSVEDMRVAERVDHLRDIPAVVRFISYEPALGPLDDLDLTGIDWVIYGGESGPGHRAEDKEWARSMRRKCSETGAAFFHKQSAGYRTEMGIELDGKIVREYPTPRVARPAGSLF